MEKTLFEKYCHFPENFWFSIVTTEFSSEGDAQLESMLTITHDDVSTTYITFNKNFPEIANRYSDKEKKEMFFLSYLLWKYGDEFGDNFTPMYFCGVEFRISFIVYHGIIRENQNN